MLNASLYPGKTINICCLIELVKTSQRTQEQIASNNIIDYLYISQLQSNSCEKMVSI
jgi:hypothetical protein